MNIITNKPIALDSFDHSSPLGAVLDPYNRPTEFWDRFKTDFFEQAKVLDIGTGTGTIVSRGVEAGYDVYGIDGTDACLKEGGAAWVKYYGARLFNADITESFLLTEDGTDPVLFDVIVSFDFLEHVKEDAVPIVLQNIRKHLKVGGIFLATVTNDVQPHHQINKPREWWLDIFVSNGFIDQGHHEILNVVRTDSDNNKHLWMVKR